MCARQPRTGLDGAEGADEGEGVGEGLRHAVLRHVLAGGGEREELGLVGDEDEQHDDDGARDQQQQRAQRVHDACRARGAEGSETQAGPGRSQTQLRVGVWQGRGRMAAAGRARGGSRTVGCRPRQRWGGARGRVFYLGEGSRPLPQPPSQLASEPKPSPEMSLRPRFEWLGFPAGLAGLAAADDDPFFRRRVGVWLRPERRVAMTRVVRAGFVDLARRVVE